MYLFGASPMIRKGCEHNTVYEVPSAEKFPWATSLRVSRFGYTNQVQGLVRVSLGSVKEYVKGLREAVSQEYPPYKDLGIYHQGEQVQLNTRILQKENEYYSSIRYKAIPRDGKEGMDLLEGGGVDYLELRILDINPFDPVGITMDQLRFLQVFFLYCLLDGSQEYTEEEKTIATARHNLVALEGRRPRLEIPGIGGWRPLNILGEEIFCGLEQVAAALPEEYARSVMGYREGLIHREIITSRRMVDEMEYHKECCVDFALRWAKKHKEATLWQK